MRSRLAGIALWCLGAAFLDQASKWLILTRVMDPPRVIELAPFLNLRLGFNFGVSFGMGSELFGDSAAWLAAVKLVVATGLLVCAYRTQVRLERVGLALIAGGALGNALDRWRQGAVTDFIDLHWGGWHWPTFNGADIAITLGVVAILIATVAEQRPAGQAR